VVNVASAKRASKGCDWIVANDVSGDVMGGDANSVHLITAHGVESWERAPKSEVARRIAERIAAHLGGRDEDRPAAADAARAAL
jgi:phosphopantothenoylcysteine decarboxylase/phosphopantothenate--cysteine ligase